VMWSTNVRSVLVIVELNVPPAFHSRLKRCVTARSCRKAGHQLAKTRSGQMMWGNRYQPSTVLRWGDLDTNIESAPFLQWITLWLCDIGNSCDWLTGAELTCGTVSLALIP
jgi:hypothetical protein